MTSLFRTKKGSESASKNFLAKAKGPATRTKEDKELHLTTKVYR